MFKHSFVVMSETTVSSSDRQSLLNQIDGYNAETFGKTPFALAVVNLPTGETVNVYTVDKQPIFFELVPQKPICPTVYIGWLYPKAYPTFFVPEQALVFIRNGADLMLPGVLHSEEHPLPNVEKGDPVFISVRDSANKTVIGPYAVGKTLMSTVDMFLNNMKGKGVHILHLYQDELWAFGNRELIHTQTEANIFGVPSEAVVETIRQIAYGEADLPETPESEDELLRRVFLYAVNTKIPADQNYPIEVGRFYAGFILKSLPENRRLQIKKTTWKFTVFLKAINYTAGEDQWFVKLSSKKGIDSITELNTKHPEVKSAKSLTPNSSEPRKPASGANGRVDITEQLSVTETTLNALKALNPKCPYREKDVLPKFTIAKLVFFYGFDNEKTFSSKEKSFCIDATLAKIMKRPEHSRVPMHDVVETICASMAKSYVISTPNGNTLFEKTTLPIVVFEIVKFNNGKSGTMVSNLSHYGINIEEITLRVRAGEPRVFGPVRGNPQLLVDGNQINYIAELLQKAYGLNKKYFKGMDLGVKAKKGGRK